VGADMARMLRYERAGAVWSDDLRSPYQLSKRMTRSSNPTCSELEGFRCTGFDGTDDKFALANVHGSVKTVEFRAYLASTTEQLIDLDGGSTYIHASAGTLTATGFTSPTIYIDGVATATIAASGWHHVAVTTGTAVNVTNLQLATDNTDFGEVYLAELKLWDRALSAAEILAIRDRSVWNYGLSLVSHLDMSQINPVDVGWPGNGNDGTGTGLAAANIVDGPYGLKAIELNGTDELITIADASTLDLLSTDDWSLSILINPATAAETGYVLAKFKAIPTGWYIYWDGANNKVTWYADDTILDSSAVFTDYDAWVHLIIARDGETTSFYRNGVTAGSGAGGALAANTNDLIVGNRTGGAAAATYFAGKIADLRIHNTALLPIQAADLNARLKQGVA
jgi:hypothetical protein